MRLSRHVYLLPMLLSAGCGGPAETSDDRIEAFVAASGLSNVLEPYYAISAAAYDMQGFSVGFGSVVPCPQLSSAVAAQHAADACRTGYAIGMRLGERIGWLYRFDAGMLPEDASVFDVRGSDDLVASQAFMQTLLEVSAPHDAAYYHIYFKERLVRDPDTPLSALRQFAEELSVWMAPSIAAQLLENATAMSDCALVATLAELPSYQGDPYAAAREQAKELLASCS